MSWHGELVSIFVADKEGADAQEMPGATAVAGCGLEGDRNFRADQSNADAAVTLIESEAIEALGRDYEVELEPWSSRRNLLTRNVPLNHLVGRRFQVGEVELEGVELCEPCGYLAEKTSKVVVKGLIHRGGLRARILRGGEIKPGDPIHE